MAAATLDDPLDKTTLTTISLLESRLLRIEHLLCGQVATPSLTQDDSATRKIVDLDKRFTNLLSTIRVYADLVKIYKSNPDLFQSPKPSEPPSQLSPEAVQAIVLASASAYSGTLSSLNAVKDSPIPDPSESAALVALSERMRGIEATQMAQAAEVAALRQRSEAVIRSWYEGSMLNGSQFLADVESRVQRVERGVRRMEVHKEREDDV